MLRSAAFVSHAVPLFAGPAGLNVANMYLQDVVNALLLCGSAYKAADGGPQAAADALTAWKRQFGGACTLSHVQCALPHVAHR